MTQDAAAQAAMTQEATERMWFRRIVTALMVCAITYGAVPVIKQSLFPAEKSRR